MYATTLFSLTAATLVSISGVIQPAHAEDIGSYRVRPNVSCRQVDHPPSVEEAKLLIRCAKEMNDLNHGTVYREDVPNLQIGAARAYNYGDPGSRRANQNAPVYPIRGSWVQYICSPVSAYMQNAGRNCHAYFYSGDGICYQTPFADWKCETGAGTRTDTRDNIPGPQG